MLFAQSFAPLTMACQMHQHSMMDSEQSPAMAKMQAHEGHSMSSAEDNGGGSHSCCDDDCNCPKGSCAQATLLGGDAAIIALRIFESAPETQVTYIPSPFQSFFKPPITA